MTPPAHCEHECVCPYKLQGSKDFCQTSCEFDTRSRPAPQQPELSELVERLTIPVGRYKGFINAAMLMQHIGLHQPSAPPAQPNPCALLESSRCTRGLVPNLFCFDGVKGVKSHRPCAYYIRSRPAPVVKKTPVIDLGKSEYTSVSREEWEQMQNGSRPTPAAILPTCNYAACRIFEECANAYDDDEAPPCTKYQSKEHDTTIRKEGYEQALEDLRSACIREEIEAPVFRVIQSLRREVQR